MRVFLRIPVVCRAPFGRFIEEGCHRVGIGMDRVGPSGRWPDPKKQGRWAGRVGLTRKLGK